MKVHIERENKIVELKFKGSVKNLLLKLKLNPQAHLVVRNGELADLEEKVKDGDEIKVVSVISGG